ncbi:hypothetical protein KR084_007603, partial [Drosophila pseudotakahashii]
RLKMLRFVVSLIVLNFVGSLSAIQDNGSSICVLTDAPNQCGAFCLSALRPLADDNYHSQMKMDRIERGVESLKNASEGLFGAVNSQIKNEFQSLLTKMENQEISMQTKLDAQLLAVKKVLEDQKTAHSESFEQRLNGTEGQIRMLETKMEAQLKELQNRTENQLLELKNQQSAFQKTLLETQSAIYHKITHPKFERIGSRYFYIENDIQKTWDEAAETCRGMGGYLAAFKTQEELAAIMTKIFKSSCCYYWTGIKKEDGKFISTASGKPATGLKWLPGDPKNRGDCVMIDYRGMADFNCSNKVYFICQSDNET